MFRRTVVCGLLAITAGCAAPAQAAPTIIEVLPTGYIVDAQSFATPTAVRQYLLERKIQDVRLVARPDTSYARMEETMLALRGLGLSFGIVGHERKER